jgi:hypothetical protein
MAIESPKYKLVHKEGKFEIREYAEYLVAEVEVDANYDSAANLGFGLLADYIFGNNVTRSHISMTVPVTEKQVSGEKIEMTSPVTLAEITSGQKYRISFSMPSKYKLETLPKPNNKAITLRKVDKKKVAVLSFSGNLNRKLADLEAREFDQILKMKNLDPKSNFVFAQYNPPWIPGPFRHDEIMVDL